MKDGKIPSQPPPSTSEAGAVDARDQHPRADCGQTTNLATTGARGGGGGFSLVSTETPLAYGILHINHSPPAGARCGVIATVRRMNGAQAAADRGGGRCDIYRWATTA